MPKAKFSSHVSSPLGAGRSAASKMQKDGGFFCTGWPFDFKGISSFVQPSWLTIDDTDARWDSDANSQYAIRRNDRYGFTTA